MRRAVAVFVLSMLLVVPATATPREHVRRIINDRRVNHGCRRLTSTGPKLLNDARQHSRDMADAGYIYHSVLELDGWWGVGEVIGVGNSWRQILDLLFQSREHLRILMDCNYDKIALGFVFRDDVWLTGRLYAN